MRDYWYIHCEKYKSEMIYVIDGVGRNIFDSMNLSAGQGKELSQSTRILAAIGKSKLRKKNKSVAKNTYT